MFIKSVKSKSHGMELIHKLSQAMVEVEDLSGVADRIVDEVSNLLDVEKVSVMAYDPNMDALRIIAARGLDQGVIDKALVRRGEGISGKVFESSKPVLIKDIRSSSFDSRGNYHTYSLMSAPVTCFPMMVGGVPLGVINVTDKKNGKQFTRNDFDLLNTIANHLAVYLHFLRLAEDSRMNEVMKKELEIARQIQYRLLPLLPIKIEGLDVCGRLITAQRVGGDYYDCFLSGSEMPAFVVADVSGHSVGAALVMAAFRAVLKSEIDKNFSPSEIAQRVNRILFEDLYQAEQFISFVYLGYSKGSKELTCTVAGHPHPLILRRSDMSFSELESDDTCLGIDYETKFHEVKATVSSGDIIVLYTDGVTEAMNKLCENFGLKRLEECIADSAHSGSKQIADVIVESVQSFIDPLPLRDDVTVLVVKVAS